MSTVYALLPCFNESENIEALITEWLSYESKLKEKYNLNLIILPIDDKSTDNTKEILVSLSNKYNNVTPLYHEKNLNLGGGLNTGLTFFKNNAKSGDLIFVMDADNTHDPKYSLDMLENLYKNNLDCVIASRYCDSSEIIGVPKHRNFLSSGAKVYYNIVLKIPNVKDYTCGYRVYTYDIIEKAYDKYGENCIQERGFSCMMELIYKIHLLGAKIGETGFTLRYDNKLGESKMKILKTIKNSLVTALKLRFKRKSLTSE